MERFLTAFILILLFIDISATILKRRDAKQKEVSCSKWLTPISYETSDENLIVKFDEGPRKCNIKKYLVKLLDKDNTVLNEVFVNSSKTTSKLTHVFHKICPGNYSITVEIFDEYWPDDNKCICKTSFGRCRRCKLSKTSIFPISGSSCMTPSSTNVTTTEMSVTTEPKSPLILNIFLAIIGAMIGLLILILSFYCFKRRIQEKRGLLFYTEDHSYHCEAIDQFVSFMNKSKCKLEVAAHLVKGSDPLRLNLEIQKSDFVILVYSNALHKRIQAWKSNQDYINFLKEDNSALITVSLLRDLNASNKLIICKFPQVSKASVSSEFPSVKCYTLTKELNLLVKQIHGTGMNQSNKLNPKYNSLKNTIKHAVSFEEHSPSWFEDKYICPKRMDSLNEMPDYTESFSDGCEHSIFSVPVSHLMEQINECNDTSV